MKIIGIITARGGSKGIPRKNICKLHGKPLIEYTIKAAQSVADCFHRVIVSTDDEEIANVCRSAGAEVPFLRPSYLARDDTPTLPVLQHALSYVEHDGAFRTDWIMVLQPTSPLRTGKDITAAIRLAQVGDCDMVVSVRKANDYHPYKMKKIDESGYLEPFITGCVEPARRQDLAPDTYRRNGAIYLIRRDVLVERNRLYGDRIKAYIMPDERSVDIDTQVDFRLAEIFLSMATERV